MIMCPTVECGRPSDHGLCHTCHNTLATHLRAIIAGPPDAKGVASPGIVDELITSMARLDRRTSASLGVLSRSAEHALPWAEHASTALADLRNTVSTWARLLHEESGIDKPIACENTPESIAAWLLQHHSQMARHVAAGELMADIDRAVTRAYRVIDTAPQRYFAGPCETPDHNGVICHADLYSPATAGRIQCRSCGALHDAAERRAWLLAAARDHLETAPVIARALGWLSDVPVRENTIHQWSRRGRLAHYPPHPTDPRQRPRYRIGDVEALMARMQTRAG